MNSEIKQDMWELLIKAAVIENSLEETKDYPSDKKLNKLAVPAKYDEKMRRFIKHYRYRENAKSVLKVSRKVASIMTALLSTRERAIASSSLMKDIRTQGAVNSLYSVGPFPFKCWQISSTSQSRISQSRSSVVVFTTIFFLNL